MADGADYRKLEMIIKGFSNHKRLEILDLLKKQPGLPIEALAEKLKTSYFNASDHVRKMTLAGLVTKHNVSSNAQFKLTPFGESILSFCKKLK